MTSTIKLTPITAFTRAIQHNSDTVQHGTLKSMCEHVLCWTVSCWLWKDDCAALHGTAQHSTAQHSIAQQDHLWTLSSCGPRICRLHVVYPGKDHVLLGWDGVSTQTAAESIITCYSFIWKSLLLRVARHLQEASSLFLASLLLHLLDREYVCTSSRKVWPSILRKVCCFRLISSLRSKVDNEIEVLAPPIQLLKCTVSRLWCVQCEPVLALYPGTSFHIQTTVI